MEILKNRVCSLLRVCFMAFLLPLNSYSQTGNSFQAEQVYKHSYVQSPEMASLIKNIVYPVNYCTGVPNIEIPLYTVNCGDLTLPIYLSYHASGIKPREFNGWVGVGWSLICDPKITKQINGNEDGDPQIDFKFYNTNEKLYDVANYYRNGLNTQPDDYYYQIPSKQGMFRYVTTAIEGNKHWIPIPYNNLKIDVTKDSKHYSHYKLTDDDGTKYIFRSDYDKSYGGKFSGITSGVHASVMIAENGIDSIHFDYGNIYHTLSIYNYIDNCTLIYGMENGNEGLSTDRRQMVMEDYDRDTKGSGLWDLINTGLNWYKDELMRFPVIYQTIKTNTNTFQYDRDTKSIISDNGQQESPLTNNSSYGEFSTISPLISKINFNGNTVTFTEGLYDNSLYYLSDITVKNYLGEIVKDIKFDYYFYAAKHLMFLKTISFADNNSGKTIEKYQVEYNDIEDLPGIEFDTRNYNLSSFMYNRCIDYWGFYNGHRNNDESLVPSVNFVIQDEFQVSKTGNEDAPDLEFSLGSDVSREPNEEYMDKGNIKSITYPSGSKDIFTFEANKRRDQDGNIKLAGGLRIREIKSINNDKDTNIRTFAYGDDECGYGNSPIICDIKNYFISKQHRYFNSGYKNEFDATRLYQGKNATVVNVSSEPITPITYDGGASVMYHVVTEYNGTKDNNIGKTVYMYDVPSIGNYPETEDPGYLPEEIHNDWEYGQMISKSLYDKNGALVLQKVVDYTTLSYGNDTTLISYPENYADNVDNLGDPVWVPRFDDAGFYCTRSGYVQVPIGVKLPVRKATYSFDKNGNEKSETENISYSNIYKYNIYPTSITKNDPDNESITKFKYISDYINDPYSEMKSRNIIKNIVKTTVSKSNSTTDESKEISKETPYVNVSDNSNNPIFRPISSIYTYPNGKSETRLTYKYNPRGQIIQANMDDKEIESYLYGYNHQYLIGEIQNVSYDILKYKLSNLDFIESDSQPDNYWNSLINLQKTLPDSRVTLYKYKPLLGVAKILEPTGKATDFIYDNFGRLKEKDLEYNNKTEKIETYDYFYKTQDE